MPLRRSVLALGFVVVLSATELPLITPQVSSVFPHGGLRGSEISVEFRGAYLDGATEIRFADGQIRGTIESAGFRSIHARLRIATGAEAGRHDFRLITPRGAWFGLFWVGTLAESTESEPNDSLDHAQPLTLPAVINGRADGADADYFRFHAEEGQTIAFDVTATRLGSSLDPVLTLFDERGRELAYNDDAYPFKDARLVHTFERAGDYSVLVSASFERSSRDAEYRLLATSGPFASSVLPLGARRGEAAEVLIHGWNLDRVDRVWLGRRLAQGRILERRPRELRLRLDIPASVPVGSNQLHLASGDAESPVPVRFEIGDLPEVTVAADAPASAQRPFRVSTPVVVNGEIPPASDHMRRVHWIEFEAEAGGRYEFKVDAWKLGECFDPVVTLFDTSGRMLAKEDDPAPNSFIHHPATHDPRLVYLFPQSGRYRLQIRDAAYEAGSGYRLTIRRTQPDFEIEVRSPQLTVYAGHQASLLAVVRRTGGVHEIEQFRKPDSEIEHFRLIEKDGWDTPIRVWVEGMPKGVVSEPVMVAPKNTIFKGNDGEELFVDGTLAEIPIRASPGAQPGLYQIRVRASGSLHGKAVEREAVVLNGTVRSLRHEPTRDQTLYLNVIKAPALLWSAPAELRISKGRAEILRAAWVRMDGEYPVSIEPKSRVAGFTVGRASASAGADEVELPVTALEDAGSEPVDLILVATFERNGHVERVESPPIELSVKP